MPIYTRKGDKGKTSLKDGKKLPKNNPRIDSYGTIDELNSIIGVVITTSSKQQAVSSKLVKIQHDLFEIGAKLANPEDKSKALGSYLKQRVFEIEREIDEATEKMPELRNFILPGGGELGARLHLARTITRRVERKIVGLSEKEKIEEEVIIYFNRLSDYLFTLARFANFKDGKRENLWLSVVKASEGKKK